MKLAARLKALEKSAGMTPAQREAEALLLRRQQEELARLNAAWEIMRGTMHDEHAALVFEAYQILQERGWEAVRQLPQCGLFERCYQSLMTAVHDYRHPPYDQIAIDVLLAMPSVVADLYLSKPGLMAFHDCEDCGFKVPHEFFKTCPLCGGKTGYDAYWHKHQPRKQPDERT